jgi:hypothetical protein
MFGNLLLVKDEILNQIKTLIYYLNSVLQFSHALNEDHEKNIIFSLNHSSVLVCPLKISGLLFSHFWPNTVILDC